jgi:hypothetical protein
MKGIPPSKVIISVSLEIPRTDCGTNTMTIKSAQSEKIYLRSKSQPKMPTFFFIKNNMRNLAPKFQDPQKKQT